MGAISLDWEAGNLGVTNTVGEALWGIPLEGPRGSKRDLRQDEVKSPRDLPICESSACSYEQTQQGRQRFRAAQVAGGEAAHYPGELA